METTKPCITKNCSYFAKVRGLCPNCYAVAINMVNNGKTTWEELASLGLAQESYRKKSKPFAIAFKEAKKQLSKD